MLLSILVWAFGGRLAGYSFGGRFELPSQPSVSKWRVISAGLQEGIGRSGAGRVTHVAEGALSIATHVFFRPDVVAPQFDGQPAEMWVELAEDSGPLWVQLGEPPGQFVQLRPGGMLVGRIGQEWIDVGDIRRFQLRADGTDLRIKAGDKELSAGRYVPGRVEFSSVGAWARLTRISISDEAGVVIFEDDFRARSTQAETLDRATIVGAVVGLCLGLVSLPVTTAGSLLAAGLIVPVAGVISQPRSFWLAAVERLYLSEIPPSQLARWALMLALLPLLCAAQVVILRRVSDHFDGRRAYPRSGLAWCFVGMASLLWGVLGSGVSPLGLAATAVYGVSGLLVAGRSAPAAWWRVDAIGWLFIVIFGVSSAAPMLLLWRTLSVASTASAWTTTLPGRGVWLLLISVLALPVGAESLIRTSTLDTAWDMSRLSGERPNEKGWRSPSSGWTGECGSQDGVNAVTVVVAGGSSVGGAYQFGGEPEAFFTAKAHKKLCASLPSNVGLTTHNFGDGDRNTFTIAHTIEAHLEGADVLVLYVGVNDIFTTQNTLTRKQREAKTRARSDGTQQLVSLVSSSRLATAASLWIRPATEGPQEGVADVPIADALENHQRIIAAARSQGAKVLLMTEYVMGSQRNRLLDYARMQASLQADDVRWLDVGEAFEGVPDEQSLADRNHLSRSGNSVLGDFVAKGLEPWVYGSSL